LEAATALLSELDVLVGFAHAACHAGTGYSRPNLTVEGKSINIKSSRHPCVELQEGIDFIPNDYLMEHDSSRFQIVTGPNMGGKSTYIRQLGTIAVMAQIGSFVPATFCELPIIDKLLVRVGAGDLQQRGVSTFMLEMLEASSILHKATANSLVIIDELGRGTSTYDGFGLAWAISVYLFKNVQCMCLFATHFHELTALANDYDQGVVNKHVSAFTSGKEITMNYTIQDGPCMESFGVHVAAMAGFPEKVVASAKRKSQELEATPLTGITGTIHKKHKSTSSEHMSQKSILTAFAALPLDKIGSNQDIIQAVSALFKSN
jgi:DNA mismatch repair protein MSH2